MKEIVFWDQHERWPDIHLILGDITVLPVDGVVTGVKSDFVLGGGVNNAIHRAAGPELAVAVGQIGSCQLGQAVITNAFKLPAKYVIHAACPLYNEAGTNNEILASCYTASMKIASQYQIQSIAFPALATGMFGFPHEVSATIAGRALRNFIFETNEAMLTIKDITFVIFQSQNYEIYGKKFSEIFV